MDIVKPMRYLPILAVLTLAACSSGPKQKPALIEHFSTEILDNGSKLFVYEAVAQATDNTRGKGRGGGGRGEPPSGGGRGGQGRNGPQDAGADKVDDRIKEMIDNKLAETGYCREGYMSLEESVKRGQILVRGECTETATEEDRATFTVPVTGFKQRIN
ncbi:hypothetical protein [Gilvimarinus agarilyticus]|uniref:hypothetical protein n=1 Tax=Gilvimarinus agarilyticus TaxID=679259 RepID=UPI0005A0C861|nr:hypothetical protein [Gilvimarinus agarilyticus]